MNEPRRLREAGSPHVRELLLHARPTQPMTSRERLRTATRVLGRVAPVSLTLLIATKSLAIGLTVSLGVVVASAALPVSLTPHWFSAPSARVPVHAPPKAPRALASVLAPAPDAVSAPLADSPATTSEPGPSSVPAAGLRANPASARSVVPVPPPSASSDERQPDSLAREAALLERARASLNSSPAQALSLADQHARAFPTGKLSLERELVAVDALRRLGQPRAARARGEALLRLASGSIYEDRVRHLLEKVP